MYICFLFVHLTLGQTETRRSNYGTITEPNDNINVYRHWKIEAVPGKKLVLVMNLLRFEFEEDCPYDYLQIRDGNNGGSPILGKYCRSPESLMLESSSNSLFITYKADATFESHFSLTYTTKEVSSPDGKLSNVASQCYVKFGSKSQLN